jgi:hypothetical protein
MRLIAACLSLGLMLAASACNTYADDLSRSQRAFEESEHERALAILRALEPDLNRLSVTDRAHYAYLRGMTDFRIGYKGESRHWLSLAEAMDKQSPGSLPPDWEKRMREALRELNDAVYSGGIASLSNTPSSTTTKAGEGEEGDDESTPASSKPNVGAP